MENIPDGDWYCYECISKVLTHLFWNYCVFWNIQWIAWHMRDNCRSFMIAVHVIHVTFTLFCCGKYVKFLSSEGYWWAVLCGVWKKNGQDCGVWLVSPCHSLGLPRSTPASHAQEVGVSSLYSQSGESSSTKPLGKMYINDAWNDKWRILCDVKMWKN